MNKPNEIQLNQFQLNILLNDEQKQGYAFLLEKGVYCKQCDGIAAKGVVVEEVFLTNLNDIKVCGTCKACNGKVVRIMEFGEDRAFYEKADEFRQAIKN
ncbi:MAG TPA: hypothetical protein VHO72_08205 [Bacteroidales bacterium]|nr:hypothetical protein [Bacteroidales bacterium]